MERRGHLVAQKHVAQHQVVDVALVAGDQNQRALTRRFADPCEALGVHVDAVVNAVPDPIEQAVQKGQGPRARVGAHLLQVSLHLLTYDLNRAVGGASGRRHRVFSSGGCGSSSRTRQGDFLLGPSTTVRSRSMRRRSAYGILG